MAFRDVSRIPLPPFGSAQYALLSVTRDRIARSAVGSGQMGSYSLAKAIGTLDNVAVGTLAGHYGSFATTTGRLARYAYGSHGTTAGPLGRFSHGSLGTIVVGQGRFRYGSFSRLAGSLPANQISRGTFARSAAGGGYGSYGTLAGPNTRARLGSFARLAGSIPATKVWGGTLARSSSGGGYGSYGTHAGPLARFGHGTFGTLGARYSSVGYGSSSGTVVASRTRASAAQFSTIGQRPGVNQLSITGATQLTGNGIGSWRDGWRAGSLRALKGSVAGTMWGRKSQGGYGSYGTLASASVSRAVYGSYVGTVAAPIVRGLRGSFGPPFAFTLGTFSATLGTSKNGGGQNGSNRNPRPANTRYRFVTAWASLGNPGVGNVAHVRICQTRGQNSGTLAYFERPFIGGGVGSWTASVSAFIDPHAGSWRIGTGNHGGADVGTSRFTSWFF